MKNSALCSQSLGPILSAVEMSAADRDFHRIGKKMLARTPLAKQLVDPTDSVLGALSHAPNPGLKTGYSDLIQKSFLPEWWSFAQHICVAKDGSTAGTADPAQSQHCPASTTEYSQMEYNFSLFWGVAIQMYESTLIADQTSLDKYLEQQPAVHLNRRYQETGIHHPTRAEHRSLHHFSDRAESPQRFSAMPTCMPLITALAWCRALA